MQDFGLFNTLVFIIPLLFVFGMGFYSRRYIRDVVDFLSAGRCARRYVISVAGMESALGVIMLLSLMEKDYRCGFAINFWHDLILPVSIIMSLTGYCNYRFRETKAMTQGQFLEIRYNRALRVFASTLRTIAEFLTEIIGPALAARFFIYFFDLPSKFTLLGMTFSTFAVVMIITICMALTIIWSGGAVALIVTDCIQGLLCYPMFVIVVAFVLLSFSWDGQIVKVLMDRVPGESFLNPFDVYSLRDFNIFALLVIIFHRFTHRCIWNGGGHDTTGITPHEQKMADLLGSWRAGLSTLMCTLLALALITMMNHRDFGDKASITRMTLMRKVSQEILLEKPECISDMTTAVKQMPKVDHVIGRDPKLSHKNDIDTPYLNTAKSVIIKHFGEGAGNQKFQAFRTLYYQMMFPTSLRYLFPRYLLGVFCLLIALIMLSTDDSRIFKISCIMAQDMVLPFIKKQPSVKTHLWLVRGLALFTGVVFFFCALYMSQLDYITMFIATTGAIWTGGAGALVVFGLYSTFGTSAGAFASLIGSGVFAVFTMFVKFNWGYVYQWLDVRGWVPAVDNFLQTVSKPFNPYVVWSMNPDKFPINGYELAFIATVIGFSGYVLFSVITYRKPFNLEKMLHRGVYDETGKKKLPQHSWSPASICKRLIGITPEYTKWDRVVAISVFSYSIVYKFFIVFIGILIWNAFFKWPAHWWSIYYLWVRLIIPGVVGIITTIWFLIGGLIDLRRLFIALHERKINFQDNGQVNKDAEEAAPAK